MYPSLGFMFYRRVSKIKGWNIFFVYFAYVQIKVELDDFQTIRWNSEIETSYLLDFQYIILRLGKCFVL